MNEDYPGDEVFDQIESFCEQGEVHLENGQMRSALKKFKKAFKLLPVPQKSYPTGTWLLTMMADINFSMKRYKAAKHKLVEALEFPEGAENPFIQLRLGQVSFEVDELEAAQKHLQIAYEIEGLSIFEDEDPKYSSLLDIKP